MSFHFDPELLKKHPYATGGVVIVGGLIIFYLLSKGGSGSSAAGGDSSALSADVALQQTQAQLAAQQGAQQTALQTAQLQAQTTNQQTSAAQETTDTSTLASLVNGLFGTQAAVAVNNSNNEAATTQQGNELVYAQNLQSMQDSVLEDNINADTQVQEYGDATNLAAYEANDTYQQNIATLQAGVASQGLSDESEYSENQLADQNDLSQQVLGYVGEAGLNHGTESLENDLTGIIGEALGSTAPATAAVQGNSAAAAAGSASTASIINSLANAGSKVATGLFG